MFNEPDAYYRERCDKCQETNWWCLSGSWKALDVVALRCWSCGNAWLVNDDLEFLQFSCSAEWEECDGDETKFKALLLEEPEEGSPSPTWDSARYERLLDSESQGQTVRRRVMEVLLSGEEDILNLPRPERRKLVEDVEALKISSKLSEIVGRDSGFVRDLLLYLLF